MRTSFTSISRFLAGMAAVLFIYSYLYSNLLSALCGSGLLFYLAYRRLEFDDLRRKIRIGLKRELLEKVAHRGSRTNVRVEVRADETVGVKMSDGIPKEFKLDSGDTLIEGTLHPESPLSTTYGVMPQERGYFRFPPVEIILREARDLFTGPVIKDPGTVVLVQASKRELKMAHLMARRKHFEITGRAGSDLSRTHRSDFKSIRDYMPGDRFRDIDWKAGSRLTKLMTKEFETETNLPTMIMVDSSLSMRELVSKRTKLDHAISLAIQIALILDSKSHPVGFVAFDENKVLDSVKPARGRVDDVLIGLFRLPNPVETRRYPGPRADETPPQGDKTAVFVDSLGPFLMKGERASYSPERISGIYEAFRSIQETDEGHRLIVLITDLETNRFAVKRAISLSLKRKNRVLLISPISWTYHLEAEDLTEEKLERAYGDHQNRQGFLRDLRNSGVRVVEIGSGERGDNVVRAIRRLGT